QCWTTISASVATPAPGHRDDSPSSFTCARVEKQHALRKVLAAPDHDEIAPGAIITRLPGCDDQARAQRNRSGLDLSLRHSLATGTREPGPVEDGLRLVRCQRMTVALPGTELVYAAVHHEAASSRSSIPETKWSSG